MTFSEAMYCCYCFGKEKGGGGKRGMKIQIKKCIYVKFFFLKKKNHVCLNDICVLPWHKAGITMLQWPHYGRFKKNLHFPQ